jgi:hypothetical protein
LTKFINQKRQNISGVILIFLNKRHNLAEHISAIAELKQLHPPDEYGMYITAAGIKPVTLQDRFSGEELRVLKRLGMKTEDTYKMYPNLKVTFAGRSSADVSLAAYASNDYELGNALGYPYDAVSRYFQLTSQGKPPALAYLHNMIIAVENGVQLPSWLAYVDHIPSEYNLKRGKVAESSEGYARIAMEHTVRGNYQLACKLHVDFFNRVSRIMDDAEDIKQLMHFHYQTE